MASVIRRVLISLTALTISLQSAAQQAASQDEAKKLLERITGTKVSVDNPRLVQMKQLAAAGNWLGAAQIATSDPNFLNVTVKEMAQKMSTREESIQAGLNDFVATFIGMVRDDTDARKILTGDFFYRADTNKLPSGVNVRSDFQVDLVQSNNHYSDLDKITVDIASVLIKEPGQIVMQPYTNTIVYNPDPAGLLTTRSFMFSHAVAGTNRRPVEFAFRQFMCAPLDDWADTTASDARIGRDIDRFPGGDHNKFQTSCKGCHTVMDGFRGAFAKWHVDGNTVINFDAAGTSSVRNFTNGVVNKMNANNSVFPAGFVTRDNSFVNNARGPANQSQFGWRGAADQGFGVKAFGEMLANSSRFSECMVKRAFEAVCRRPLNFADHSAFIKDQARRFETQSYNMKKLFQMVALSKECGQ